MRSKVGLVKRLSANTLNREFWTPPGNGIRPLEATPFHETREPLCLSLSGQASFLAQGIVRGGYKPESRKVT
jgi:hypothetical protein